MDSLGYHNGKDIKKMFYESVFHNVKLCERCCGRVMIGIHKHKLYIDRLLQEIRNSIADALE